MRAYARQHRDWLVGFFVLWLLMALGVGLFGILLGERREWPYAIATGFLMAVGSSVLQIYRARATRKARTSEVP